MIKKRLQGPPRWHSELADQLALGVHLVRWIVLGSVVGLLAGVSSYVFLVGLDRVSEFQTEHGWLLFLLPVAGLLIGLAYHYLGGRSGGGNSLIIEEIHQPTAWVPRRMAPLVLGGTWITHLFGGSAGREGTAIQMSGSLSDGLARLLRLGERDRRVMLVAAIAGGFGAVFGVPLAGVVFALEVQSVGRARYEALVPSLAASLVGHMVVHGLGYAHGPRPQFVVDLDWFLFLKVAAAGLAFGLASIAFVECTHAIKRAASRFLPWAPARPVVGGIVVIGLALTFGRQYLGLSLPLIDDALAGQSFGFDAFALKLIFTAVTLGCAFPGGEVTPLFVIGATLGAALAGPLQLPVALLAAVGFVAVFAGAANTPLACTVMGVELFGAGSIVPVALGCVVAYVFSNHRGIYTSQRISAAKGPTTIEGSPSLSEWARRYERD